MQSVRSAKCFGALLFAIVLLFSAGQIFADVTASISGTVTDPSGAAVEGAMVTATNVGTQVVSEQTTNSQGFYSFQSLPLGKYTVEVRKDGFKTFVQTDIILEVDDKTVSDVTLQVGQASEKIEVSSSALHVETANTQMGEVIEGKDFLVLGA